MAYDRRSFAGAAAATTLNGGIDGSTLSITIASSTGWPSGSAGDFYAVIDRGTATEEKVRVDTRTGTALTLISGGRGVDGTAAAAHSSGATIELCLTAVDLDEANAHLSDTALDHHTQYLNTTRHDVTARHTFGAALPTPAAAADISTAAGAGAAAGPARADHVHKIGTGAINAAGMFAAGVVDAAAIATDAVGSAEIAAGAVTASELAADAVTTAKILDANVTTAKIAAGAVTAAKVAAEAWTPYTPTWTNLTIGNAVVDIAYIVVGGKATYRGSVVLGSTSAITGTVSVSIPVAAKALSGSTGRHVGDAMFENTGVRVWSGSCSIPGAGTGPLQLHHTDAGNNGHMNATTPFTFASGSAFYWCITFEVA